MSSSAGGSQKNLKVDMSFHGKKEGQELPPRQAYLFDSAGRLVEVHNVTDGPVNFGIQASQRYQVVVGPKLISEGGKAPPDLMAQLTKAGAMRKDYLPELNQDSLVFPIYPPIWLCWWKTCILVHGTVRKLLNPGGTPAQYAPICTGTVQIFQVDLGCTLDKLASFELTSLRDRLVSRLTVPQQIGSRALLAATQASTSPGAGTASLSEVAARLATLDGAALKQYMIAQKAILFPFWCEFIPDNWFCWQELGEAPLQSDGSFSAEVCFWCPDDFPDLYFEVVQNLGGIEREIYDPQIACSTYYNYDGSQSVDIVVDDPEAVACLPDPNPGPSYLYVWPTAIGNVDLKNIDGLETGVGTGLVASSSPLGTPIQAPWGGTLDLQMQFHPGLQASNILYYRWSYLFDGDSTPTPIINSVTHRYKTIAYNPGPPPQIIIQLHSVTLGPQTVGGTTGLFAIPDPTLDWIDIDDPADRPFAYFNTGNRSGMCTLILEMFDNTGKFVPCNNSLGASSIDDQPSDTPAAIPFTYILPDISGPPNTYTNAPTPNITDHGRLIFRIQVDNSPTTAALPGVSISGGGSTDSCGFVDYTSDAQTVSINYTAWQPNNFISWSLGVVKGLSGPVASASADGNAPGAPLPAFASLNNSAGTLVGTCPHGAAFAVNLYCWAWATDGYSRQSEYDSSATIAFALLKTS